MKNITVILLLIVSSFSFAQETKQTEKPSFVITFNLGGNIFTNQGNGYEVLEPYTLHAKNWELGYRLSPTHEVGLIIGTSDFPNNHYEFGGGTVQNGVLIDTLYRKVSTPDDMNWLGVYYVYHFKDIMHGGLRFAHLLHGGTYNEFFIGKEIPVLKNCFARVNVSISSHTKYFLNFSERNIPVQYGATLGFGVLF